MKKTIILFILILSLCVSGCEKKEANDVSSKESATQTAEKEAESKDSTRKDDPKQESKDSSGTSAETSSDTKEGKSTDSSSQKPAETKPSGNTTNSQPEQKKGQWEERTVLVKEAWDEQVLVSEGWTEKITIKEGWSEEVSECSRYERESFGYEYVCNACGFTTTIADEIYSHEIWGCKSSWHNGEPLWGEEYCAAYETKTIEYPGEYSEIYHEPVYSTVHHEAEYKTERVWVEE